MKKYNIIWFYVFTLLFSVISGGISSALLDELNIIALVFIQTSPLLGLLLLCVFMKDFTVFKELKWGIAVRGKVKWIAISIVIPIVIIFCSSMVLSFLNKPYVPNGYGLNISLLVAIVASIVGCFCERVGWNGFLLSAFYEKKSLLISAILTGLLWGAWHFGKIPMFGLLGYLLFILLCVEFSILMAWIYIKTDKSLLPVVVFHFMINICSMLLLVEREGIMFYIIGCIIGGVLCAIVILRNLKMFSTNIINK